MKYADSRLAVLSNVSKSLLNSSLSTGWFSLASISGCCSTWKRVALRQSITSSVTILQTRNVPTRYFKHGMCQHDTSNTNVPTRYFKHECAKTILQTRMCQHDTANTTDDQLAKRLQQRRWTTKTIVQTFIAYQEGH